MLSNLGFGMFNGVYISALLVDLVYGKFRIVMALKSPHCPDSYHHTLV